MTSIASNKQTVWPPAWSNAFWSSWLTRVQPVELYTKTASQMQESAHERSPTRKEHTAFPYGRVLSIQEAPAYLRRDFILTGYLVGGTHLASVRNTLFRLNNETLNAWTMVMAVILSLSCFWYSWHRLSDDLRPFVWLLLGALPHSPFSIGLHTMIGVSESTRARWRTLDVFFILTCAVPRGIGLAWYAFPHTLVFWVYTVAIGLDWLYCVLSTCILRRIKDIPKHILARDVAVIVICYQAPAYYAALKQLVDGSGPAGLGMLVLKMLLCSVGASWTYSRHVPERWSPGTFDLVGNSHQIMHVLVVLEYYFNWRILAALASHHWKSEVFT